MFELLTMKNIYRQQLIILLLSIKGIRHRDFLFLSNTHVT